MIATPIACGPGHSPHGWNCAGRAHRYCLAWKTCRASRRVSGLPGASRMEAMVDEANALLARLRSRGAKVRVDAGQLIVERVVPAQPDDDTTMLRQHKAALLALLAAEIWEQERSRVYAEMRAAYLAMVQPYDQQEVTPEIVAQIQTVYTTVETAWQAHDVSQVRQALAQFVEQVKGIYDVARI